MSIIAKKHISYFLIPCALGLLFTNAKAQVNSPLQASEKRINDANTFHRHHLGAVSLMRASAYLDGQERPFESLLFKERALYLKTNDLLALDRKGALDSALLFLKNRSNKAQKQRTAFHIATYFFYNQNYAEALKYYELAGIDNLTNEEIADTKFETAYCYFVQGDIEKAEAYFGTMRETPGKYYNAGNYYYGLLAYNKGDYKSALRSFARVENDPTYSKVVPYYVAEINYFQGHKNEALKLATDLLAQGKASYYTKELHLLSAQILFEEQNYPDAIPHFEYYYNHSDKIKKEQLYEMGYSYYKLSNYPKAIDALKVLSETKDEMGQNSMYILGNVYLKNNDKRSALNAYNLASQLDFDKDIQLSSILNAGKLSYELGYYDQSYTLLKQLIEEHSQTEYAAEGKIIYSDLLARSNRYQEAYDLLKNTSSGSALQNDVMQKVAYGLGVQKMQEHDVDGAKSYLKESLSSNGSDEKVKAKANFWLGEIAFQEKDYNSSIQHMQSYLTANPTGNYNTADANLGNAFNTLGYDYLALDQYEQAQDYFGKAKNNSAQNEGIAAIATLREADAAFMQKDYATALKLYDDALRADVGEKDYATLQKAIIYGLQGRSKEKIALLKSIANASPRSARQNDARYELGVAYNEAGQYNEVIKTILPLTETDNAFTAKSLLLLGFSYTQLDQDNDALAAYKRILKNYPSSDEKNTAQDAIKAIYLQQNQPEKYADLLQEQGLEDIANSGLDSTFYNAAIVQYSNNNYQKAAEGFEKYKQKFPNGLFSQKADYYLAESYSFLKKDKEAAELYEKIALRPTSEYTENSARKSAQYAIAHNEVERAKKLLTILQPVATTNQNKIFVLGNLMKIDYAEGDITAAATKAKSVLEYPSLTEKEKAEAGFFIAREAQQNADYRAAKKGYDAALISNNNEILAESRYRKAEILYNEKQYAEAEKTAAELLKKSSGQTDWVVRTYILISDILVGQKDFFNAKATLQSVIKNSKNEAYKKIAEEKLQLILNEEKQNSKITE